MSDRSFGRLSSLVATPPVACNRGDRRANHRVVLCDGDQAQRFALRHVTMPVFEPGSTPLRVLRQRPHHDAQPVSQTGLGLRARRARAGPGGQYRRQPRPPEGPASGDPVPSTACSRPGLFVFGSNDYFGPTPKNPLKYFDTDHERQHGEPCPGGTSARHSSSAAGSTRPTARTRSRWRAPGSWPRASTTTSGP